MNLPFTFPAPVDAFIAYQEQIAGRALSRDEREITAAWLEIINEAEPGDTEIVDHLIAQHPDKCRANLFLETVKTWMEVAAWTRKN